MNTKKYDTIHELFELMYAAMDYDRVKRTYGTGVAISSSEIYLIKCIAEHPDCNVTLLARLLGVSKAAISQLLKKIEKKGMVVIERDAANYSRYVINVSDKGKLAHAEHMKLREGLFDELIRSLDGYADESVERIYQFLVNSRSIFMEKG